MMLGCKIFDVLKLAEWFSMTIIWHATERSIWYRFEVATSSKWCVVLMHFFISVSLTPGFISVSWLRYCVFDSVLVNHLIINYKLLLNLI